MTDRTANLLGTLSLAVADRVGETTQAILNHSGETAAALVVIGYGFGPSNERLRKVLGLSHPGCVRLVDRLAADGLVERRPGKDRRAVALHLTPRGREARERILEGRIAAIRPFLSQLAPEEEEALGALLHKLLASLDTSDLERCQFCRLCDDSVCTDCPIPADFRTALP
ncbi:MAG: MarR family transcriptional regulator [Erythrobacter sp.]|uniref:MarR family winged helix-turn-helix transcriptional regulator n=1 Tax=Erythrobacter sp. TaxID=1042 RepID=UPI002616D171|nr:MarR family transcriptional regulator [Erythrobacter sp.]MDJ0979943.1 MarR family transcriptional regulator [Erythrobacter sp.]